MPAGWACSEGRVLKRLHSIRGMGRCGPPATADDRRRAAVARRARLPRPVSPCPLSRRGHPCPTLPTLAHMGRGVQLGRSPTSGVGRARATRQGAASDALGCTGTWRGKADRRALGGNAVGSIENARPSGPYGLGQAQPGTSPPGCTRGAVWHSRWPSTVGIWFPSPWLISRASVMPACATRRKSLNWWRNLC
jgi:hypothetical protein